jgi:hypothetical protein
MSESIQDFGLFERLSSSMEDPYVDRKMEQARDVAELLNGLDYSKEDRDIFVRELDDGWIYRNKIVTVSGVMWWKSPDQAMPKRTVVNDIQVISDGFMFDPDRFEAESEYIEGKQQPSFAFKVDTGRSDGEQSYAAMHFDDIFHIEYPFPSPELRNQRFRYHYPRHCEDIDYAIFNSRDTSEMIADLAVAVEFEGDTVDQIDMDAVTDLQNYLDDTMDLEKELPYRFTIVGQVAVMTDARQAIVSTVLKPLCRLGIVKQVRMLPDELSSDVDTGAHRYVPYLEMRLFDDERGTEPKRLMVPFSSLLSAVSIRDES